MTRLSRRSTGRKPEEQGRQDRSKDDVALVVGQRHHQDRKSQFRPAVIRIDDLGAR
jgi:hypothetical protein